MWVIVKTRLGCAKQKIESFGSNRYYVYLTSQEHELGNIELIKILSRFLGTPVSRINLQQGESENDKILEVV